MTANNPTRVILYSMKKSLDIFITIIVLTANLLAIYGLRQEIRFDPSDKAIILYWFFYPALVMVNVTVWLMVKDKREQLGKTLKWIIFLLILIFLPMLFTL